MGRRALRHPVEGRAGLKSLGKWRATAREAGKQSRRLVFPEVADVMTTRQVAGLLADADFAAVLHEEGSAPLATAPLPDGATSCSSSGPKGRRAGGVGGLRRDRRQALPARRERPAHLHRRYGGDGAAPGPHRPLGLTGRPPEADEGGWTPTSGSGARMGFCRPWGY
ncbi:16S rRNA (uracil(1498)-N(3))-methyltransferase [Streptomyces sp. M19]